MLILETLLTLFGAGTGAVARFALGGWVSYRMGPAFPWGTLVVNTLGCFGIGLLEAGAPQGGALVFVLGSGLLAGFTTFSTLMLETLNLALAHETDRAFFNILGSVALGLPALYLGLRAGAYLAGAGA